VALDITAKKAPDFIGYLDERLFREKIWHHRPITDIWNIGHGIATRLQRMRVFDLHGITLIPEDWLYKEFGINAELIIDHANGIEPCTIADIKAYQPRTHSLSNSQILFEDYNYENAKIIMHEMVDGLCLELVDQQLVTNSLSLAVQYSKDIARPTGATRKLKEYTNSIKKLQGYYSDIYSETTSHLLPIRRIGIGFGNLIDEIHETIDLFTDVYALERERSLQRTLIAIRRRYGRNAVLKGISYNEKATALQRNRMVGGHAE
jgi:DNA polymerase V